MKKVIFRTSALHISMFMLLIAAPASCSSGDVDVMAFCMK
jgi:hypothetical protein